MRRVLPEGIHRLLLPTPFHLDLLEQRGAVRAEERDGVVVYERTG